MAPLSEKSQGWRACPRFCNIVPPRERLTCIVSPMFTAKASISNSTSWKTPRKKPATVGLCGSSAYGEYGTIYVRDIAYWQGNDAFATYLGYGCILYDDGYAEFPLRYQVAAGGLAYTTAWTGDDDPGDCDIFIPNEL